MFIKNIVKTDKKTGKQYNYYRLCESYRIGNKVRHRSIVSMGKLEGIDSKEDRKLLADTIEKFISGQQTLFLFDIKPEIENYAREFADRIISNKLLDIPANKQQADDKEEMPADYDTVNLNSLRHENVREIGAEWMCLQTLNQLKFKELLTNSCGQSTQSANISLMHIISRAVYPASEHKTAQWIKENSSVSSLCNIPLDKVNRYKLYTASNNLYKQKKNIEKHLSVKTNKLFDLQDKIIFYDLTNTYFEGRKRGSKLAKFGRGKEKRSDCKIVSMAAVVNAEGFLKSSRIYQGDISDSKTLNNTIDELSLQTSSSDRKPIIVMDAGVMTDANALLLKSKGYDYICVSRIKLKNYNVKYNNEEDVVIYDRNGNPIKLRFVENRTVRIIICM